MVVRVPIYKERRLVLARFVRGVVGDPVLRRPAPDVRGHTGAEHGPTVGLLEGANVVVKLRRERLAHNAELHVKSSDTSVFTVVSAAKVSDGEEVDIELRGVSGGNPKTALLEARFGSDTGPIVARLEVWVLTRLTMRLTPHVVSIASASAAAVVSAIDVNAVVDLVRAIWRPCGIDLSVQATQNDSFTFAAAGRAAWQAEVNSILGANFVPHTINAYFVNCLVLTGSPGVLGLGLSRTFSTANGLAAPGILLGDTNVAGSARAADPMWVANDLAHEIGHFLTLDHTERKEPPNERTDLWSRQRLMHNFNLQGNSGDWHDHVDWGTAPGGVRRGCQLTMKNLAQVVTDGECTTTRAVVTSAAGPY